MANEPMKEKKLLIFSNIESGSNCNVDCKAITHCNCDDIAFRDEITNFNHPLEAPILAIIQTETLNGKVQSCKMLGANLCSVFYTQQDYNEWYSNGKNILSTNQTYGVKNSILYRAIRPERYKDIQNLMQEINKGMKISPQKLASYTTTLHPHVAEIYGWN